MGRCLNAVLASRTFRRGRTMSKPSFDLSLRFHPLPHSLRAMEIATPFPSITCALFPIQGGRRSAKPMTYHLQPTAGVRYNGRMPVKLIALDIDGTLLDSHWLVSEANRKAIAEAARRGIEVALVTGRRYDFAMPVARQLDTPLTSLNLTMIVNNGALIRSNDGRTHLCHLLPQRVADQVLRLTKPWREGAAVIFDRPAENQLMLERLDPDDSLRYAYYSRNKQFIGLANPLEACLTESPIQVMLSGKVAPMREAEHALRAAPFAEEYALAVTMYEHRDFSMIDVLNPICSKGASLAEWATLRGLAREEVMA